METQDADGPAGEGPRRVHRHRHVLLVLAAVAAAVLLCNAAPTTSATIHGSTGPQGETWWGRTFEDVARGAHTRKTAKKDTKKDTKNEVKKPKVDDGNKDNNDNDAAQKEKTRIKADKDRRRHAHEGVRSAKQLVYDYTTGMHSNRADGTSWMPASFYAPLFQGYMAELLARQGLKPVDDHRGATETAHKEVFALPSSPPKGAILWLSRSDFNLPPDRGFHAICQDVDDSGVAERDSSGRSTYGEFHGSGVDQLDSYTSHAGVRQSSLFNDVDKPNQRLNDLFMVDAFHDCINIANQEGNGFDGAGKIRVTTEGTNIWIDVGTSARHPDSRRGLFLKLNSKESGSKVKRDPYDGHNNATTDIEFDGGSVINFPVSDIDLVSRFEKRDEDLTDMSSFEATAHVAKRISKQVFNEGFKIFKSDSHPNDKELNGPEYYMQEIVTAGAEFKPESVPEVVSRKYTAALLKAWTQFADRYHIPYWVDEELLTTVGYSTARTRPSGEFEYASQISMPFQAFVDLVALLKSGEVVLPKVVIRTNVGSKESGEEDVLVMESKFKLNSDFHLRGKDAVSSIDAMFTTEEFDFTELLGTDGKIDQEQLKSINSKTGKKQGGMPTSFFKFPPLIINAFSMVPRLKPDSTARMLGDKRRDMSSSILVNKAGRQISLKAVTPLARVNFPYSNLDKSRAEEPSEESKSEPIKSEEFTLFTELKSSGLSLDTRNVNDGYDYGHVQGKISSNSYENDPIFNDFFVWIPNSPTRTLSPFAPAIKQQLDPHPRIMVAGGFNDLPFNLKHDMKTLYNAKNFVDPLDIPRPLETRDYLGLDSRDAQSDKDDLNDDEEDQKIYEEKLEELLDVDLNSETPQTVEKFLAKLDEAFEPESGVEMDVVALSKKQVLQRAGIDISNKPGDNEVDSNLNGPNLLEIPTSGSPKGHGCRTLHTAFVERWKKWTTSNIHVLWEPHRYGRCWVTLTDYSHEGVSIFAKRTAVFSSWV